MKNIILLILILFLTACAGPTQNVRVSESLLQDESSLAREVSLDQFEKDDLATSSSDKNENEAPDLRELEIPSKVNWAVPFQSQAPLGDWSLPYQEACEEASMIQASAYFNEQELTAETMKSLIRDLVDWQDDRFGGYYDSSLREVKIMAEEYFALRAEIGHDLTQANLQYLLSRRKLILFPVAGRLLNNPYFSGDGPIFHYIVLRGYKGDIFITNDVGTRRGEAYEYDWSVLRDANHDLPVIDGEVYRPYVSGENESLQAERIKSGEKGFLIIDK